MKIGGGRMKQVNKSHCKFLKYINKKRWICYYYQIYEILKRNPKTVLEIGPGPKIIKKILEENNIKYYSLDVAEDLNPDFIGDVRTFNLDKKFDMVVAFQILEHIPFEDFDKALSNVKKHANDYVLISLPYPNPFIKINIQLYPFFNIDKILKIPFPKEKKFDGEHYWEIGRKGYPLSKIKKYLNKFFEIEDEYLIKETGKEHIFICKIKKGARYESGHTTQ